MFYPSVILQEGTSIPLTEESIRCRAKNSVQPYALLVNGQEKTTVFIQVDQHFLQPESRNFETPLAAVDCLFKIFHCLQLEYPPSLKNFYNFLACYAYNIEDDVLQSVTSLHTNIENFAEPEP